MAESSDSPGGFINSKSEINEASLVTGRHLSSRQSLPSSVVVVPWLPGGCSRGGWLAASLADVVLNQGVLRVFVK